MKVKLRQLWIAGQAVHQLSKTNSTSARANYWIGKAITAIDNENRVIEATRNELIKKYGKENDDKSFTVVAENMPAFSKEFEDLLAGEVDINVTPIELEYLEGRDLAVEHLTALDFIIKEPKE